MGEPAFVLNRVGGSDPSPTPDLPIEVSIPYRSREKGASRHFGFFPFFAKWSIREVRGMTSG
jgi:hypothetical protein